MSHEVSVNGHEVSVEVARDQQKRYIGLSEKQDLGPDEGMLFVWPTEKEHRLVMRDMSFGVDMVFADASGTVTKVASARPDDEEGVTAFSKYALELPHGWCSKAGVTKEDSVTLNLDGLSKSDTPIRESASLKETITQELLNRADMDVGMFAALASETPDPEQDEVDAPYNDVEGDPPDGTTTMSKDDASRELEGVSFYSEINDTEVKIEGTEGDKVRVTDGENEWWERMEDVRDKIVDGAWEEKDDPCWDGYEQVGMKEGENGEKVPNCVPKDETKAVKALNEVIKQSADNGGGGGNWVPYQGPKGGEGWQNAQNPDDVRYQPDPPGEVHPDYEDMAENWGEESESENEQSVPDEGVEQRDEGYFVAAAPNPEKDIPSFQDDETATEIIETTNSEPMEGFSVHRNLDTYDATQDDAWIVGMTSVEVSADEGLTKDDVTNFYKEFQPVLEETPALRIGGYHFEDGDKISIDLSVALTDREEAESLGSELNQESVFNPAVALGEGDWENGSVMTGGDGASPVDTPEDVLDTLNNVDSLAKSVLRALRQVVNSAMTKQEGLDPEEEFVNDDGRTLSRMQIFRYGWKEGAEIESVEDGYIVNGEQYRPVTHEGE